MGIIAVHSNRLYKKDLEPSIVEFLNLLIKEFNAVKVSAYCSQLKTARQNALISKSIATSSEINSTLETKPLSLYKGISGQFANSSVYLINSAINEAKAIQKSQDELRSLNIKLLESKLEKINNKIFKVMTQKQDFQYIKDNLKVNNPPFKKGSRKYKLDSNGQVIITLGKGKNKRVIVYDNMYLFETQYLKAQQKHCKQRLGALKMRQYKLECQLTKLKLPTYIPQVVFGGKKLQKQANNSKAKNKLYKSKRANQLTISGRNDSKVGNYVFEYDYSNNRMIIKINKKQYIINNVNYPYGKEYIIDYYQKQLECYKVKGSDRKPITYSIVDYGKYYIIKCFVDIKVEPTIYGKANGVIGVDTNLGFWSVADISADGNLISTTNINYDWRGSKGQTTARIRDAAKELVDIALKTGKPIVIEDLKIQVSSKNKAYNSSKSKNYNRNMFSYDKMTEALISRAYKYGVEVYMVKPYYTSLIGKIKFMPHYKLSIHNLAAFAIGRRYLQFNENVPKRLKKTSWKDVYKMKVS